MVLDIREGDFLVVNGKDYPIKSCGDWSTSRMNTPGFKRMATVTAKVKRTKKNEPVLLEPEYRCTPLDPVDPELRRRLALETPHELLQTFITDSNGFVHLILEDLKR